MIDIKYAYRIGMYYIFNIHLSQVPALSWPKAQLLTQLEAHTHTRTYIEFYANDIKDFVTKICHNDCVIIITMLPAGPGRGT